MLSSQMLREMSDAADAVIDDVLLHGARGMRSVPRSEIGLVAAVTLGGINEIAQAWGSILAKPKLKLALTGVFCHGAPMVQFGSLKSKMQTCELADLLVVVDFPHHGGTARTASLIQAKMAAKARRVVLTGRSSIRQLELYQAWPRFSFVDSMYGADRYILATKVGAQSGTFGVIDRHFRNKRYAPPIWTQHQASPTPNIIANEPRLGTFIANMAAGSVYGRKAWPGGKDDWSKVVDLLLNVTYGKVFRHRPTVGPATPHRGVNASTFFLATGSIVTASSVRRGGSWQPPFDGFEYVDDPDSGGISLLHVQISR